jgi:hypothetical protein
MRDELPKTRNGRSQVGGLGWRKRLKNRNKCLNLFASGVLLGMLYDMTEKALAGRR